MIYTKDEQLQVNGGTIFRTLKYGGPEYKNQKKKTIKNNS